MQDPHTRIRGGTGDFPLGRGYHVKLMEPLKSTCHITPVCEVPLNPPYIRHREETRDSLPEWDQG